MIFFHRLIHTAVLTQLEKNNLRFVIGKENYGCPSFKGTIMDFRFYYEVRIIEIIIEIIILLGYFNF